jgi:hypothetical protein
MLPSELQMFSAITGDSATSIRNTAPPGRVRITGDGLDK